MTFREAEHVTTLTLAELGIEQEDVARHMLNGQRVEWTGLDGNRYQGKVDGIQTSWSDRPEVEAIIEPDRHPSGVRVDFIVQPISKLTVLWEGE